MKTLAARAGLRRSRGLAQAASIAAPWNGQPLWWLQLLSLAALVWQLDALRPNQPTPSGAARRCYGWLFATAWLCGTFWWLFISMHTYGGLAAPLAALAVLALRRRWRCTTRWPAPCSWPSRRPSRAHAALFFAALWTLAELLRGSWFTGFPWGAGGYAHVEGRWPPMRPGSASTASARWPRASRRWRRWRFAMRAAARWRRRSASRWCCCACLPCIGAARGTPTTQRSRAAASASRCCRATSRRTRNSFPAAASPRRCGWYGEQLQRRHRVAGRSRPKPRCPLLPSQLPPGYLRGDRRSATPAARRRPSSGMPLGDGAGATPTPCSGFRPGGATPTATTSTTSCPSASSSRGCSAGSPT